MRSEALSIQQGDEDQSVCGGPTGGSTGRFQISDMSAVLKQKEKFLASQKGSFAGLNVR